MLSNHLRNLLRIQNRLIVPELGAFLLKADESNNIYFNEFLRFNDGLLLGYIAEQEKIETIDAARMIKAFVDEANKKLQTDRLFEIEGVGTLFLDSNDKIQFRKFISDEPKTSQQKIVIEPDASYSAVDQVKNSPTVPELTRNTFNLPENGQANNTSHSNGELKSVGQDEDFDYTGKVNGIINAKNIIIVASILVIVLVLAYLLLAHQAKNIERKNAKDTVMAKLPLIKKNDLLTKSMAKTSSVVKNPTDSEMTALKSKPPIENGASTSVLSKSEPIKQGLAKGEEHYTKKFFIIAGCFSEEANANRLVNKLKSEGYPSEKFATIKNRYYVSFSSYSDKDTASHELKKLKNKGKTEAWIMPYLPPSAGK